MKRKFTILTAVFALLAFLTVPMGMRGQTTKTYKLTIDASDFNTTSYAANNNEKTSDAVNINDANDTYEVSWTSNQVMKSGNNMQWQKSKGYIYNSTDLGTITAVTVTSSAGTFTTYYGTEEQPSTNTAVGGGYFQTKVGAATGTTSKLEVTFEVVADGPQIVPTTVTIDASDITNTDVYTSTAAGSLNATVTENTNNTAISGATVTWSSSNENVATIDANGEVTLVAAGTTTITASYAGESGVYGGSSATYELVVSDNTPFTGGDVTFDAGTDMGSSTTSTDGDEMTKKTVTISSSKAAFGYNDSYRIYSGSTTTISTTYGVITEIVFTGSSSNPLSNLSLGSASSGSYSVVNSVGTWTGNATSVSFSATAQARATQIVVTVAAPAAVAAPTFSPETGTYYETQNVTISCETPNSTIYYTTDGSEPTSASTQYSQAITVNETTTIKAIAYVGTDHGYVSTATYTIVQPYSTIQEIFNAATNTPTAARIAFDNWVVTGVNNSSHAFVSDGTNGFMIYGSDHGFSAGDILSGTVECSIQMYNNALELTNLNSSTTGLTVTPGGTVSVADIAIANLAPINTGALVSYQNLTCSVNTSGNYTNYNLTDGTTQIQVYHTIIGSLDNLFEDGKTYNITGIFVQNNSTKRVNPRSAADIEEVEVQHEVYTLTVTPSANVEIYTFVSDDPNEEGQSGELIAQVYDGTTVGLSVSAASGYMLESVLVDGVDVTSQLDDTGWYEFTMPTHDVAVTATAVEYVPFEGGTYTLATSIESGKSYIIVGKGDNIYYAMGEQKANNRAAVEISVDGTTATVSSEGVYEFTISSLDAEGFYSIQDASSSGYLYAASSNSNYLRTESTLDENHNGDWEITINSEGIASVVASNSDNRNVMQYNSSNHLFSCYATASQHSVYLYVKDETPVAEPHTVYFYEGTGDCEVVSLTGATVSLPTATINSDDWSFAGWATSPVNETTSAPTLYTGNYTPTEDMFLYAVYQNNGMYNSFPACIYTQLDVTEGFENYTESHEERTFVKPTGWTLVTQNEPVAKSKKGRPQVFYCTAYAQEGGYSLFMDSLSVLAMPKLADDISFSGLEMEFYLRQPFDYQYIEVGVMSDLSDPESFELIEAISNVGSAINRRVVDFSGYQEGGRYIAFRNAYGEESVENGMRKSFNYIDNIILRSNVAACGITELPYIQDFDSLTNNTEMRTGEQPECWTEAQKDANYASTYAPQLFHAASYAHSGEYTLMLDGRCIYAMPEFKVEGKSIVDVELEFNVRQSSASCLLQVGVMSNLNDANSFIALDTISNNGFMGQQVHAVDFGQYADRIPEGAKYIAFRNIYNGTWGRSPHYIDDVKLTERVEDNCDITELPYTQNFDNLTEVVEVNTGVQPECWTEVMRYVNYAATYDPQLVHASSYAHSGAYTLMLDGRCLYAMPKIDVEGHPLSDMQLEFYVRQYSANCKLVVGVMSDVNNPSTFVELDTISNNGASGQRGHVVDFGQYAGQIPSGAKYIAFRNIYDGTWGRSPQYLDDITLSIPEPEAKIAEVSSENVIDANSVERYLEDIRVYPNPTTGNLYIDAMDVQKVECYNQMGQLVGVYDNANELNISELSNGVYMLRITVPQGVTMRKVVKK